MLEFFDLVRPAGSSTFCARFSQLPVSQLSFLRRKPRAHAKTQIKLIQLPFVGSYFRAENKRFVQTKNETTTEDGRTKERESVSVGVCVCVFARARNYVFDVSTYAESLTVPVSVCG